MNKSQQSDVRMFGTLISFINSVADSIISSMPHFSAWFADLTSTVAQVYVNMAAQGLNRKGFRQNKLQIRALLTISGMKLSSVMMSYATVIGDPILYNKMNFTKSAFDRASDIEIIAIWQSILNTAAENLAALAPYNITGPTLDDFSNLIEIYKIARPQPRTGIAAKKTATKKLKTLIAFCHSLIKNMDGVVTTIESEYPDFTLSYFDNRTIVDEPTIELSGRGKIVNADGQPMPFVHITCESLGLNRKATANGTFFLKNAVEGMHDITFEFPGFTTVIQSVRFYRGIRAEILVTMFPH